MKLDDRHFEVLIELGLPADLYELSDDEAWLAADEAVYEEMMLRCVNEAGDALTERGELCADILSALAEID